MNARFGYDEFHSIHFLFIFSDLANMRGSLRNQIAYFVTG